ncbi:alpha/beta hydrolase [Sphingomonas sp. NSE70-1]|uniref:Alpha/beta hydrolase n=1 Tax=Sphingomonas caseinilyticus TaxID=2908205 RepID=A0ABT0RXK5_9SPHN|nr:alpha/beta hydrolase [Sphingomonas caseinilyticus]MCL6699712.1 alpha/beta hydrolase [Sphingomonas caseinilyticus]
MFLHISQDRCSRPLEASMSRIRVAIIFLALVIASIGSADAFAAPVDQASWVSLKKEVRLPNGLKLNYVELGNPKGEPLLLLHGYTDSSRSWSLTAPYLAAYRLLIPDQRGHGGSDAPECCYSTSQFADDARLFLDALGVRRAAVAGHSLGSMVAISLAADHPDRVSRLILIGSTALEPVKRGDWLYSSATALKAPLDKSSPFLREWHPSNQPTSVDPQFANAIEQEYLTIPLHVWHGVMRELAHVPVGRHAEDIKIPVLLISGGKDPLFPAEHHASLRKAFPHAEERVFGELGHNPNWERPEEVGPLMERFLSSTR